MYSFTFWKRQSCVFIFLRQKCQDTWKPLRLKEIVVHLRGIDTKMADIHGLNHARDHEVEVAVESASGTEKTISLLCTYDCS